ncbi:GntR family transcriptional regulator of abcA and norABC [Bacillus ectoiniformans]|uniref:aminotransferase-like domain-containing protein n=1 Tax=Bacillus ectoiniformans TaxID=1494429 RepID=UPI00195B4506|nr:PLP-dependent aminotransferase family protein [Bacillus ectoiniformans]MBM7649181.1 GntR family transcriptional regulator of abcA and norABC [Bacillus ectoiniformans]
MPKEHHQSKSEKVIHYIKNKISEGEWPIGHKIASQRKLAEELGVNRSTVVAALEQLKEDGLLKGVMGKGTIVINNTWTLLAAMPQPETNEKPKPSLLKLNQSDEAEAFEPDTAEDFIQLSKGELAEDIFPVDNMQQVMMRLAGSLGAFGYEEPKGYLPLREAISAYMKRQGKEVSAESILIVSGALQGIQLISAGLLTRGSSLLLEKPSYLFSMHVFQSAGMTLKGLPMDEDGLIPSSIPKHIDPSVPAIVYTIPSFHNPTGVLMTEKRRKELLDLCASMRLPIIEDDIYRELWIDAPPPPPLASLDENGDVLYVGSLSKTLSPGLRIGWIAGAEPVIERLAEIKRQTDYGSSSLSQRVAAEWMASGLYEEHLSFVRQQLKKRRTAAISMLQTHLGDLAEWDIPSGGFLIWLRLKANRRVKDIHAKAYHAGILLNPGSIYTNEAVQAIRLSYGYASMEDFETGIKKLKQIILDSL